MNADDRRGRSRNREGKTMDEVRNDLQDRWHDLLLAVAGWVGDPFVSAARAGEDESTRRANFLIGAAATGVTEDDLTGLLATVVPGDPASIARVLDANAD